MADKIIPILARPVGDSINSVNARELHAFLGIGKVFAAWIRERIEAYGFVEGRDFVVFSEIGNNSEGRPRIEYALSLDMAKELAMVERNEKGRQARAYFIECERVALDKRAAAPAFDPADPRVIVAVLEAQVAKVRLLEAKVAEAAPKAEALDRIATRAEGSMCITDAAKALQVGPKRLFAWLSERKWIYRRAGGKGWLGYQCRIQQGVIEHKVTTQIVGGEERLFERVLVTPKGLARLAEALSGEAA